LTRLKPAAVLALVALTWTGCSSEPERVIRVSHTEKAPAAAKRHHPLNVYAATKPGRVRASVAHVKPRVYVPESRGNAVDVIDPHTFKLIRRFRVGREPQHITPSWDMRHLYVNNTQSNTLTVIDPRTGKKRRTIHVRDPYNLYFTPDGRKAIVVAERFQRLDFRDPRTWRLIRCVHVPWYGVDHLDFSADGHYLFASTEFSGVVVKIDTQNMKLAGHVRVGGLPVDVKLSANGRYFYVANQRTGGVTVVDPVRMKKVGFIKTGVGAHGLSISRDTRSLYVSNRVEGSISVIDLARRRRKKTWHIGGSPDMLQVSPDGRQLWTSDRFNGSVTVVSTKTGHVLHRIAVGAQPHGLAFFPQPGRFSLGHNGVYR
jgi:YVTN family beta-propeller protein